ncbi:PIN domain-containing protein [Devosia enhydra]|nr:PIN domain-containing protein [Devosia enhydra]
MLDTNIVSELMRQGPGRLWQRAERYGIANLCMSIISAAELRYGAELKASKRLHDEITDILTVIHSMPFTEPAGEHYGEIRALLTRSGTPIGSNDLLIAAHALALDLTLISDNVREFARIPGLRVENWLD